MQIHKGAALAIAGSACVATLALGATFAPSTLAAFTDNATSVGNTAAAGTLNIDVVDSQGNVKSNANVAVSNASPEMATRQYTLSLKNSGSLDASMRVKAVNLIASAHNLNDVLKVQITDQLNHVVYTGKVSDIDFTMENLPATVTTTYVIRVTWPDDPAIDDNPYQAATLTFDLTADASVIAGQ